MKYKLNGVLFLLKVILKSADRKNFPDFIQQGISPGIFLIAEIYFYTGSLSIQAGYFISY